MASPISVSYTAPTLTTKRSRRSKEMLRFDRGAVASRRRLEVSDDLRFFVTAWAFAFVIFYNFLF